MPDTTPIAAELFTRGATWIRADFHLHTIAEPGRSRTFRAEYPGEEKRGAYLNDWIGRLESEGVRVGVITNHNAFDVPGYNESTPIDVYPGFVPEDFHLRKTSDGFYRKWDNTRDWNDAWQVQNLDQAR